MSEETEHEEARTIIVPVSVNGLQRVIHNTAVEKGWWETERNVGEVLALVHSEISEAWDEYKAHSFRSLKTRIENGKPEGFHVELADAVIRLLDLFDVKGLEVFELTGCLDPPYPPHYVGAAAVLNDAHADVSLALECWRKAKQTDGDFFRHLTNCMNRLVVCSRRDEDFDTSGSFERALHLKIEFNKTRPYRHGGKAA
jgi:hypothetical protein